MERIGRIKHGAPATLEFRNACDEAFPHAYEVGRLIVTNILFKNWIARGVRGFKCMYFLNNLPDPWRSFKAWRRHRRAIRNRLDESQAPA